MDRNLKQNIENLKVKGKVTDFMEMAEETNLTIEEYENIIKNMQLFSDPIRFNQLILSLLSSISEKVNKIEEKLNLPELPKL